MEFLLCIPHRMCWCLALPEAADIDYLSANGIVQGIRPIISYNYGAGEGRACQSFYYALYVASIMFVGMLIVWGFAGKSDRTVHKKSLTILDGHRRY